MSTYLASAWHTALDEGVGWGDQLPHWHNRWRMECCQTIHPELVVFTKQRPLLVREVLAVEVCEPTCPAAAENHLNFEEPVEEEENTRFKLL